MYQLAERAGTGSCTLAVSDIEEVISHLQRLGIDGNHLAFAEAIDQSMAR